MTKKIISDGIDMNGKQLSAKKLELLTYNQDGVIWWYPVHKFFTNARRVLGMTIGRLEKETTNAS
mgnify:CR=1 FL=1